MQEYFENDNLDREAIEMYQKMPAEERRALIEKITAEELERMNNK